MTERDKPVSEGQLDGNDIKEDMNSEDLLEEDTCENEEESVESELLERLQAKEKECEEYLDLLRRTMADFDNFRKRAAKEKDSLYDDGFADAIRKILPVLDNFDRAVSYNKTEESNFYEGVSMILKMFKEVLSKAGVEEIEAEGKTFDPDYHNAIMHVEDESLEDNVIVEVLQRGYIYKDRILRHSMVKVAN